MIDKMIKAVADEDYESVKTIEMELLQLPIEDAYKILTNYKELERDTVSTIGYYDFAKMTPKKEIFWKVLEYSRAKEK